MTDVGTPVANCALQRSGGSRCSPSGRSAGAFDAWLHGRRIWLKNQAGQARRSRCRRAVRTERDRVGFSLTVVRRIDSAGVRRRQGHARFARRLPATLDPATRPRSSASIAGKLSFPARTVIADFVSGRLRTRTHAHLDDF